MIRDMSFGRIFQQARIRKGFSLRAAAIATGLDVGNLSKLERGLLAPPNSWKKIEKLIEHVDPTPLEVEFLKCAAFNFHLGKLQERFA